MAAAAAAAAVAADESLIQCRRLARTAELRAPMGAKRHWVVGAAAVDNADEDDNDDDEDADDLTARGIRRTA